MDLNRGVAGAAAAGGGQAGNNEGNDLGVGQQEGGGNADLEGGARMENAGA